MRVALVGAGRAGRLHATLLARQGVQVLIYDANSQAGRDLAREVGGTVAHSALHALASSDAAVIAAPPELHATYVRAAVDARRPVLCEKPLADTAACAEELERYVRERGGRVEVGFQRRFDPGYGALRDALQSGGIGQLQLLRLNSIEPGLAPSPKTNIFRNTAIHDLDLIRWISGDDVVSIHVQGSIRTGKLLDRRGDPDTIVATMQLARGSLAVAAISRLSPNGYDARAELLGSKGYLCTGIGPRTPLQFVDGFASEEPQETLWDCWRTRFAEAFERQMATFLEAVRGNEPWSGTLSDAVVAQRLSEAARQSMEQDAPVRLE